MGRVFRYESNKYESNTEWDTLWWNTVGMKNAQFRVLTITSR